MCNYCRLRNNNLARTKLSRILLPDGDDKHDIGTRHVRCGVKTLYARCMKNWEFTVINMATMRQSEVA